MEIKYIEQPAKPRNNLPDISMMIRPHNGKEVRIANFSGTYYGAIEDMNKHYWHSEDFSDITFAPVTTVESLSYATFGMTENRCLPLFCCDDLNAGIFVRTPEGVYINPGKAIKQVEKKHYLDHFNLKLDMKYLINQREKATKVNGIYLGENDFAFAPWKSFNNEREQSPKEFAEGGLARAIEHTSEKIAEKLYKVASSYRSTTYVMWFEIPKKPVIGQVHLGSKDGSDYFFQINGNSYMDKSHYSENPNKDFYITIENGGRVYGKLATNKGKPVN